MSGTFGRSQGVSERQLARRAMMLNCDGQATALSGELALAGGGLLRRVQSLRAVRAGQVTCAPRWQGLLAWHCTLLAWQHLHTHPAPPLAPLSSPAAVVVGHCRSVVRNASDRGWVHTLAAEVECMRAQYAGEWGSLPDTMSFFRQAVCWTCSRVVQLVLHDKQAQRTPCLLCTRCLLTPACLPAAPAVCLQSGHRCRRPRCWSVCSTCCSPSTCSPRQASPVWGVVHGRTCCCACRKGCFPQSSLANLCSLPGQCCIVYLVAPSIIHASFVHQLAAHLDDICALLLLPPLGRHICCAAARDAVRCHCCCYRAVPRLQCPYATAIATLACPATWQRHVRRGIACITARAACTTLPNVCTAPSNPQRAGLSGVPCRGGHVLVRHF